MHPVRFEPTISAGERAHTYALDRVATGTNNNNNTVLKQLNLRPALYILMLKAFSLNTRVGTLMVATIYLQLIQNRYMFRSFTVLHCSHQHCVQSVASDVEVVGYL